MSVAEGFLFGTFSQIASTGSKLKSNGIIISIIAVRAAVLTSAGIQSKKREQRKDSISVENVKDNESTAAGSLALDIAPIIFAVGLAATN